MDAVMGRLIEKYGSWLTLERAGEQIPLRGILQPVLSRQEPRKQYSPLGQVHRGRYLYMGPVTPMVAEGDVLIRGGRHYEVRQAEQILCRDRPVYCWAMCVEKGR